MTVIDPHIDLTDRIKARIKRIYQYRIWGAIFVGITSFVTGFFIHTQFPLLDDIFKLIFVGAVLDFLIDLQQKKELEEIFRVQEDNTISILKSYFQAKVEFWKKDMPFRLVLVASIFAGKLFYDYFFKAGWIGDLLLSTFIATVLILLYQWWTVFQQKSIIADLDQVLRAQTSEMSD